MKPSGRDLKKTLREHLKGITASNLDSLAAKIAALPYERLMLSLDVAMSIAATNLRVAVEMLKNAADTSRLVEAGDLRVWAEAGKRLAATSPDSAVEFFQESAAVLESLDEPRRGPILRLVNKQAALSAGTALETFRSAPAKVAAVGDGETVTQILEICQELARHSVKHSSELLFSAPEVLSRLRTAGGGGAEVLIRRALDLTAQFSLRSGGTAAELFSELPAIAALGDSAALAALFDKTESYLDRSGGVALQYFRAASRVLIVSGEASFRRWTELAERVAGHGNAASYHFMKSSPGVIGRLSGRSGSRRGGEVVTAVLEVVEELANVNTTAAIECFNASPIALSGATVQQFREWALRGPASPDATPRQIQAYYSLESKTSQEALSHIEGGLTLDSVAQTLRLYVEGLTGRSLNVASLAAIPDEAKIGDGKTIYLPAVIAEFDDEEANFRLFKVLAAHAAGQIEFETYARNTPGTMAALADAREAFAGLKAAGEDSGNGSTGARRGRKQKKAEKEIDFLAVLSEYPDKELAMRLFTTIENGRIDYLLRFVYRGIRRDLNFVRERLIEGRPGLDTLGPDRLPFELLFQTAICGGCSDEARAAYPGAVGELERILNDTVFQRDAGVEESLHATRLIHDMFNVQPVASDEGEGNGDEGDGDDQAGASQSSASEATGERQEVKAQPDPFSFWSPGKAQEVAPDSDLLSQMGGAESTDQDLEKGDRVFHYDEWDRELGDFRTLWCRVVQRSGGRGSRGFVENVRSRYAGVISSIRYQFQMLRPENLRRIRGEIDGEDYDLQAVIDYALDKRSTGLIDDRLYTRKLRRERDVAVSFLLDMSSSTARTISRYPHHPYSRPGQRIIDIEKEGLVLMSEALESVGDIYSIQGFTSEGRRNVKFYVIKDYSETYSESIERRIGGITYHNNTRLGAAIRHATARLVGQDARTRLLVVLSDGRPYDHDYGDSRYAREDTRVALREARVQGVTPFCITIDRESEEQLRDMYGEVGYTIIDDVLSLPERLPGIYRRLTT